MRRAFLYDPEQRSLQQVIRAGFPMTKANLPELVRPYWAVHERLSVDDGLVVYGCRLVIPRALRRAVVETLHDGHLGKELTKARGRQIVFCPGLDRDIENVTKNCRRCQRELPAQQRERRSSTDPPLRDPSSIWIWTSLNMLETSIWSLSMASPGGGLSSLWGGVHPLGS